MSRPRGRKITLTAIDELALAEAAKTGLTAAADLAPDYEPTPAEAGLALAVLEGRVAVLEQRVVWLMDRLASQFGAKLP